MNEHKSHKKDEKDVVAFAKPAADAREPQEKPAEQAGGAAAETANAEAFGKLAAEKEELKQTLLRRQADFDNYRKRIERDRLEESRRGVGRLLEELLPILDSFERALRAHSGPADEEYRKGLELIYRQMWDTLARQGIERIDAAGKPFDPHFHQAIERVETPDQPDHTVLEVLQDGFLFHGRVLRPAVVRVAVAPQDTGGHNSAAAHHQAD
jgi:molecular chaperone GrpE